VTSLLVYPKGQDQREIKLFKEQDGWYASTSGKTVKASTQTIINSLTQLLYVKTKRVAATSKDKWDNFEVGDSSGTIVKVYEGDEETLNMVIGRFDFNQMSRSATSFIRLADDDNVYTVDGLLDMAFNKEINSWRDRTFIKGDPKNWEKLIWEHPDSSMTLEKNAAGNWVVDGAVSDSTRTTKFLRSIANLDHSYFVEDADSKNMGQAAMKLTITISGSNDIIISAYPADTTIGFALVSSQNPSTVFNGKTNKLTNKIFVPRSRLLAIVEDNDLE
ncbi:MAG: DUF4340 domain-containing protein, partial [Bacteroidetes bacterium]|nr:DUF4340 domain-containing protein [Bacteroidota bacterium]